MVLKLGYHGQGDTSETLIISSNDPETPLDTITIIISKISPAYPMILLGAESLIYYVANGIDTYSDSLSIANNGLFPLIINRVLLPDSNFIAKYSDTIAACGSIDMALQFTYNGQSDTTENLIIASNDPAHPFDTVRVIISSNTTVAESALSPAFGLRAYPNPFLAATQFTYALATSGNVSIIIYDVLGRK